MRTTMASDEEMGLQPARFQPPATTTTSVIANRETSGKYFVVGAMLSMILWTAFNALFGQSHAWVQLVAQMAVIVAVLLLWDYPVYVVRSVAKWIAHWELEPRQTWLDALRRSLLGLASDPIQIATIATDDAHAAKASTRKRPPHPHVSSVATVPVRVSVSTTGGTNYSTSPSNNSSSSSSSSNAFFTTPSPPSAQFAVAGSKARGLQLN